jgi:hypothetical protein
MAIPSVCPRCGVREVLLDKMAGRRVRCPECGQSYRVGNPPSNSDAALANDPVVLELRQLRRLIARLAYLRLAWNLILLLAGIGLWLWFSHRAGMAQNNADQQLQKLLELLEPRP